MYDAFHPAITPYSTSSLELNSFLLYSKSGNTVDFTSFTNFGQIGLGRMFTNPKIKIGGSMTEGCFLGKMYNWKVIKSSTPLSVISPYLMEDVYAHVDSSMLFVIISSRVLCYQS